MFSLATRDETIIRGRRSPQFYGLSRRGTARSSTRRLDAERERVKASLGLEGRGYIGFLGTLEPRKNVPNLCAGWASRLPPTA